MTERNTSPNISVYGNQHLDVGARVRAERNARRRTLDELAATTGQTKGFLSKFERGQHSISVAALVRICDALAISVTSLFQPSDAALVRAGETRPINFGGVGVDERLLTPTLEKRLQAILSRIDPSGNGGEDLYVLRADAEFVHVLSGEIEVIIGDTVHRLCPGDTLTFNPKDAHTWRNPSAESGAVVLWVTTPAP